MRSLERKLTPCFAGFVDNYTLTPLVSFQDGTTSVQRLLVHLQVRVHVVPEQSHALKAVTVPSNTGLTSV